MMVEMKNASTGQIQIELMPSSSAQTVYIKGVGGAMADWFYSAKGNSPVSGGATTYNYMPALYFNIPANEGNDQWMANFPTVNSGTTYTGTVDVAGTGQAYLDVWTGGADVTSSVVTLGNLCTSSASSS
jgi:hypothetical protein